MWPEISASLLKFVSHACEHEISLSEIYLAQFPAVSKANNLFEHTRGRSNMSAVFQWQLFDAATIHNLCETHKSLLANMFMTSYPPHPGSFAAVHTWKSTTPRFLTVFLARTLACVFYLCVNYCVLRCAILLFLPEVDLLIAFDSFSIIHFAFIISETFYCGIMDQKGCFLFAAITEVRTSDSKHIFVNGAVAQCAHTHTPSAVPWHETNSLTSLSTSHSSILTQRPEKDLFVRSEVCCKIWQPYARTYKSFMPFNLVFLFTHVRDSALVSYSHCFEVNLSSVWLMTLCHTAILSALCLNVRGGLWFKGAELSLYRWLWPAISLMSTSCQ